MSTTFKVRSDRAFARFMRAERSGSVVMNFALGGMVLFGIVGLAVNYATFNRAKENLQEASDAGALAAAKELGMVNITANNVDSIVAAVVEKYVLENMPAHMAGGLNIDTRVDQSPLQVVVNITQGFEAPFKMANFTTSVGVKSIARIVGKPNVCVLGLDETDNGVISLEQNALVTAHDCAVYSNSTHTLGIKAKNSANLTASLICSRGGRSGGPDNFNPEPLTDCPGFDDPLASRPEPSAGSCLETGRIVSGSSATLFPGTYCGGLKVTAAGDVELNPGIYIFKDGPLTVDGGAILKGVNVGLFFTGAGAVADFAAESTIELTAPEMGPMAGLLMFESRSQPDTDIFKISSDDARMLLGTIYLPRSELRVDANSSVADQSAYTAIVARAMRLYGGPHLVLNTNYKATTIPVPDGIKGAGQPVALVE